MSVCRACPRLVEWREQVARVKRAMTGVVVDPVTLAPDQTYFFRVVSRDAAGNTATDDKAGKLYAFHTLLPLLPPTT